MQERLEYNEKQGHFHYAKNERPENTFGWVSISEHHEDPSDLFTQFTYYMQEQYPGKLGKEKNNVKAVIVKKEWKRFLLIRAWVSDYQNNIYRFHGDTRYQPKEL